MKMMGMIEILNLEKNIDTFYLIMLNNYNIYYNYERLRMKSINIYLIDMTTSVRVETCQIFLQRAKMGPLILLRSIL